jgi:hypothetical protein
MPDIKQDYFSVYLPISKVEEQPDGTCMVWGRATQEVPDAANEIMDYASSVPYFKQRIEDTMARSDGNNMMPLRAMHQNIAAGRVMDATFLDSEKAIDICAHVVDDNEVKKVKAHVYTGLSVGGKYIKRVRDGKLTRYTADPHEISLVDAPAVPTARLTLFKVMDAPADTTLEPAKPEWVEEFQKSVALLHEIRKTEALENWNALAKLQSLGERVGIPRREGSPLFAPKEYPPDPAEYGDPANFFLPMDEAHYAKSINHFNEGHVDESVLPQERHILGRRVARLASRFGKYQYDPGSKTIKRKETIMADNVAKLDIGGLIAQLKSLRDVTADQLSKNPEAMKDIMSTMMGSLDSMIEMGGPVNLNAPVAPVSDASVAVKAVATETPTTTVTPTTASTPSSPSTPAKKADGAKEVGAGAKDDSSPSSTPSTPSTPATAKKVDSVDVEAVVEAAVSKALAPLNALIEKLNAKPMPVSEDANSPLNALNSMVEKGRKDGQLLEDETEDEIAKVLLRGGPYAGIEALRIASGKNGEVPGALAQQMVNNVIAKASYATMEEGGVITKERYRIKLFEPPAR